VGAENPVTSRDLHVLVDEAAELAAGLLLHMGVLGEMFPGRKITDVAGRGTAKPSHGG
jgi:hypothetical protein